MTECNSSNCNGIQKRQQSSSDNNNNNNSSRIDLLNNSNNNKNMDLFDWKEISMGFVHHDGNDKDEQQQQQQEEETRDFIEQCQTLRCQIFVQEQGIPREIEIDGKDYITNTIHVMVSVPNNNGNGENGCHTTILVGTGRITLSTMSMSSRQTKETINATLGRIAITKEYRNYGLGTKIVQRLQDIAIRHCRRQLRQVQIQQQAGSTILVLRLTPHHYLESFYNRLGFHKVFNSEVTEEEEKNKIIINNTCQLIAMEKRIIVDDDTIIINGSMTDTTSILSQKPIRTNKKKKKVCIFGTSANPPTGYGGHLGIIQAILDLNIYDEIHVLPVYEHPYISKKDRLVDYNDRINMCQLAIQELTIPNNTTTVLVSRAEERSYHRLLAKAVTEEERKNLKVGTADLLDLLMEEEDDENQHAEDDIDRQQSTAGTEYSFCLGADTFLDLTAWKWKRSKDVLRLLDGRLVVVHRKTSEKNGDSTNKSSHEQELQDRVQYINEKENGQVTLLDVVPTLQEVSSSMARQLTTKDELNEILPSGVVDYIIDNKLYGFAEKNDP